MTTNNEPLFRDIMFALNLLSAFPQGQDNNSYARKYAKKYANEAFAALNELRRQEQDKEQADTVWIDELQADTLRIDALQVQLNAKEQACDVWVRIASSGQHEINRLSAILLKAAHQFQFYADEHRKAGKAEKAKTNQEYADMCGRVTTEKKEV